MIQTLLTLSNQNTGFIVLVAAVAFAWAIANRFEKLDQELEVLHSYMIGTAMLHAEKGHLTFEEIKETGLLDHHKDRTDFGIEILQRITK